MQRLLQKMQATINILPDAAIVADRHVKIVMANPEAFTMFGYQPDELIGQDLNVLLPERFRKRHNTHFLNYLENPVKCRMGEGYDLFGLRKDGREVDVDIALAPVNLHNEQMVLAIIRDISLLKELDRTLLKKNEELSLSNTRLERLGYVIAHDLKSPLLNIHAIINLLDRELQDKQTPKTKSYFKVLNDICRSMMNLITGVADYSKAGFEDEAEEDVDLNLVMKEVCKMTHFPPEFNLSIKGQLPVIRGNKTKVLQIFLNLVNNAVKYNHTPSGLIEVSASASEKVCLVSVADNGPGVPEELRGKIFDLFRKGSIQKENSQGIGLAVVKKIIEDRGGHIVVEASPLGGANFIFSWPATNPNASAETPTGHA